MPVRDLGLRQPLALCEDCLTAAVAVWRQGGDGPVTVRQVLQDAVRGVDPPHRPPAGRDRPEGAPAVAPYRAAG